MDRNHFTPFGAHATKPGCSPKPVRRLPLRTILAVALLAYALAMGMALNLAWQGWKSLPSTSHQQGMEFTR